MNPFFKLFTEDQTDRKKSSTKINWTVVSYRDELRREKAQKILNRYRREGIKLSTQSAYYAAMLFQHGASIKDSRRAVSLSRQAMNEGLEDAKWLYAAATDRLLMKEGRLQKFGTQSIMTVKLVGNSVIREYVLYPYDFSVSDAERRKYNVPPLRTLKAMAKKTLVAK